MVHNPDAILRYRNRAEELRAIADVVKAEDTRESLREWAAEYDRMVAKLTDLEPPTQSV
jgi:hypothetical protein